MQPSIGLIVNEKLNSAVHVLVRDSSAVRRLFVRLAGAVGRQSALHKENSGFAAPTLGRHISTFRCYRILLSIRNPYINRFTNHFSIHSVTRLQQVEQKAVGRQRNLGLFMYVIANNSNNPVLPQPPKTRHTCTNDDSDSMEIKILLWSKH